MSGATPPKQERPIISKPSVGKFVGEGGCHFHHPRRSTQRPHGCRGGIEKAKSRRNSDVDRGAHCLAEAASSEHHPANRLHLQRVHGAPGVAHVRGGLALVHPTQADLVFKFAAFSCWHAVSFVMRSQALCHLDVEPGNILRFQTTYVLAYDRHKAAMYALGVTISEASRRFTPSEFARVASVVEGMMCCEVTRPTAAADRKSVV